MKKSGSYLPEGSYSKISEVNKALRSPEGLDRALNEHMILEAAPVRCTPSHELVFDFGFATGLMPREKCALGVAEGETREIAILTRVGKPTCFEIESMEDGVYYLSRTAVQKRAQEHLLNELIPGDVIPAKVTHLEPFGAFVDIGAGVASLIGIENLSVSRITHPCDRFTVGQDIYAAVRSVSKEEKRIALTHRELLGTWSQNAAMFSPGETVKGIVRSVEPYGVFIELAPNLSGLAEKTDGLWAGTVVSVYIKSIIPSRMKVKLAVIDILAQSAPPEKPPYFIKEGHIGEWVYTPPCCDKKYIATSFENEE